MCEEAAQLLPLQSTAQCLGLAPAQLWGQLAVPCSPELHRGVCSWEAKSAPSTAGLGAGRAWLGSRGGYWLEGEACCNVALPSGLKGLLLLPGLGSLGREEPGDRLWPLGWLLPAQSRGSSAQACLPGRHSGDSLEEGFGIFSL